MKVKIRLVSTSQPIIFEDVSNTYTKGELYCLYFESTKKVKKYPLVNIFDIEEEY